MEVMYLLDAERSMMLSGSDNNEIFAKRLLHEFQTGMSNGHFTSYENEKAYKCWLKTLKEENVLYHANGRLYRKSIKYDTHETLFLQVLSFDNSFQGCAGFVTFEDDSLKCAYDGWLEKRSKRLKSLYQAWRDTKRKT